MVQQWLFLAILASEDLITASAGQLWALYDRITCFADTSLHELNRDVTYSSAL